MKTKIVNKEKEPRVAIITSTYSQDELLIKNLKSLKKLNYYSWKFYLIDDASQNKLGKKMKKLFPWINLIVSKNNNGFSISNNLGIKKAIKEYNPDYILLLNDDCESINKNWLKSLVKIAEEKRNVGILGCQIIYPDKSLQWFAKNGKTKLIEKPGMFSKDFKINEIQKINNVLGAMMLIKRGVIEKIGLLDEGFSPFYGEETDFCFRALKKGFEILYVGNITVIHHRNKSISKLTKEDVWFIKKRNSIRLEWRYYSLIKNIYYSIIHFGSIFKNDSIKKNNKFKLLFKAYIYNLREKNNKY